MTTYEFLKTWFFKGLGLSLGSGTSLGDTDQDKAVESTDPGSIVTTIQNIQHGWTETET